MFRKLALALGGRLDLETEPGRSEDVGTIARIMYRLANEEGGRYVVLNLTDVRWMSSEVINALFVLYRKLQARNRAAELECMGRDRDSTWCRQ